MRLQKTSDLNVALLHPQVQNFIDRHIGADVARLALSKNPFAELNWNEILEQIASKTKAKEKLPTWFATPDILYPSKISVEQTSSETTAKYKSDLIGGQNLIDLTGGFGVDDFYFAKRFNKVVHCELNSALADVVSHNFKILGVDNVQNISGDSTRILEELNTKFDWIYIDPSRRNSAKGKVFLLADCLPDVPLNLEFYLSFSENIMIKTAPLLDLSAGLSELSQVSEIHVVALENEVKELLWIIKKGFIGNPKIKAINILKHKTQIFDVADNAEVMYAQPQKYLYEPNAAIMKTGAFNQVGVAFDLLKLHRHSHLYTSNELVNDFPGRTFQIQQQLEYNKQQMKQHMDGRKANVTTRNFPESVESIRKKWKLKEGGNDYCFFTTELNENKIVLICTKL